MTKKPMTKKVATKEKTAKNAIVNKATSPIVEKEIKTIPLKSALLNQLEKVTLANPFEQLGLIKNTNGSGFLLRVWLPEAKAVSFSSLDGSHLSGELTKVYDAGFFEINLPSVN